MNQIISYDPKKNYKKESPGKIMKFMWWCSGADEQILGYSSYADHIKFFCLGAVVLSTGVMAFISMGFAIQEIFHNPIASLIVGIIWSLIIFNLDRFIVSSTGKGDGTENISRQEWKNAIPRLVMASILGLTISAPLETKLFDIEIEREWIDTKDQLVRKKVYEIEQLFGVRQQEAESNRMIKKKEVDDQILLVEKKVDRSERERKTGAGPQWRLDTAALTNEQNKLAALRSQLDSLERYKASLLPLKIHNQDSARRSIMAEKSGFLDKLLMLSKLEDEGKSVPEYDESKKELKLGQDGKPVYKEIVGSACPQVWAIRILFMLIEICPVIFKLMLIKSTYDYISENNDQLLQRKQGIRIKATTIMDENNKAKEIFIREHHLAESYSNINEHLIAAQEQVSKAKIDKIKEEKLKD